MSFKFDKEYLDFYKDMAIKEPNHFKFKDNLECFIEWMEGLALCDCGHGCRDTFADNGAKLTRILRMSADSNDRDVINEMLLKDPKEFLRELHTEQFEKARNAPKT